MSNYIECLESEFLELKKNGMEKFAKHISHDEIKYIFSKGASINIRPYEIERAGFKLGKKLKKAPSAFKNIYKYYLDIQCRVIKLEIFDGDLIDNEFYSYQDNKIISYFFDSAGDVRNVRLSLLENEVFVKDINYGKHGYSISDYQYNDGLLSSINVFQKEHNLNDGSTYVSRFEYNNHGLESITNVFPNSYKEKIYP